MTDFILDATEVKYAEQHPFDGCYHPRKAAYGRVAEPILVDFGAGTLGLSVLPFYSTLLPTEHKGILDRDKRHDGLLFDGDKLIGVIEAKLALRPIALITNEKSIYQHCRKHNLRYIIALGKMVNIQELQCSYMGVFNLCDHPDVLSGVEISVVAAERYLNK